PWTGNSGLGQDREARAGACGLLAATTGGDGLGPDREAGEGVGVLLRDRGHGDHDGEALGSDLEGTRVGPAALAAGPGDDLAGLGVTLPVLLRLRVVHGAAVEREDLVVVGDLPDRHGLELAVDVVTGEVDESGLAVPVR